jgi:hypothetical protein
MREEVRWWLARLDADGLSRILARLDGHGLRLGEPVTGKFWALHSDGRSAGEAWATTPAELLKDWGSGEASRVAFRLWMGPALYTLVEATQDSDKCELGFDLDGFWFDDAEKVTSILFWNAITTSDSIAMVASALFDYLPEWPSFVEDPELLNGWDAELVWVRRTMGSPQFLRIRQGGWFVT